MFDAEILTNPRLFIPNWFEEKNLRIESNLVLNAEGKAFELSQVFASMWLDYRGSLRDNKGLIGFPEKDLMKALEEFMEIKRLEDVRKMQSAIRCSGENLDELKRFLLASTGACDEIQLAVLAHSIWQVKRKVFNKKVKDHQMVVFKGKQGAGKTEAIKMLFGPMREWFKGASLKEITDERWKYFFKSCYVVFCDELQHAEWASVDALKGIISGDKFPTRRLGTNIYDTVTQNCTFVGATNRSVGEIIRDSTGMRRFFEIETLSRMNWDEINTIDAQKIWQGIDENRDEPYIAPFKKLISVLQDELIIPEPEETFLAEFKLLDGSKVMRETFVSNTDLYAVYCIFVKRNGDRQKPSNTFHRRIKNCGLSGFMDRQGHAGTKGYVVTQESINLIAQYKKDQILF